MPSLSRRALLAAGSAAAALAPLDRGRAAAPKLGQDEPRHYRVELGGFELTLVSDTDAVIDGPWPIVGEDRSRREMADLMHDNLLPPTRFQPGFSPAIVNTGREIVLFDTGNGDEGFVKPPLGGRLGDRLAAAGFAPDAIDIVMLTHCHIDHIGGLMKQGRPQFPNARYVVGRAEYDFWRRGGGRDAPAGSVGRRSSDLFATHLAPLAAKTTFIEPGQSIVPGIEAVAAYGHTAGHLAFHVDGGGGRQLLVWGDCAHHQVASLARPDWHALFDQDKEAGAATRRKIYEMAARERLPVVGYHMPFPSLGYIEPTGGAYRWLPHTYQLRV